MNLAIKNLIMDADIDQLREILTKILDIHTTPVFGAAKLIEHEIAALNALRGIGFIDHDADEFQLVEKLRITRNRARFLLYQSALRESFQVEDIDDSLRRSLKNIRAIRDGSMYLVEVSDPLTMDRLRKRIRDLGFISDGSFSGSLAKIPEVALVLLIEDLIPEEKRDAINKRLLEAGMADTTIPGAIRTVLAKVGGKILDEAGENIGRRLGDHIIDCVVNGWDAFSKYLAPVKEV